MSEKNLMDPNDPDLRERQRIAGLMENQDEAAPDHRPPPKTTGQRSSHRRQSAATSVEARIDAWAKDQDDKPTRPDAMRRLIERGLGQA
jgi:hypothetical protein